MDTPPPFRTLTDLGEDDPSPGARGLDHVLTLIAAPGSAALTVERVEAVRTALGGLGAETDRPRWLAPGEACDIAFAGLAMEQAEGSARAVLADLPVDLLAQPVADRKKALLISDMDSTIVTSETLDDLAEHAGLRDAIAAITRRAMNGELDFAEALRERVGMLADLSEEAFARTWADTRLTTGARALVGTMKANGARCLLVSGGFRYFTSRVADLCGFDDHVSNDVVIENGRLTGAVVEPVRDRQSKLATLMAEAGRLRLPMSRTLAVGDGANDLPMLLAASLGVAFHARPAVAAEARAVIRHGDLTALLFAQGYTREEFTESA
ncbi:phosphoserine phosphatase SerB [Rhodospira trueperi]|uniref:Phosphoserine phosphatase n=1 Tax=Rhodospira trueperi TaxID=69960 RepID=A0A1G7DF24_9PROT|nr:phosphoserine phosphatase SerB [Rhodospira trueperi]SDE50152.1 phosphoserine phosphatase [Rhodospira trueperi]